MEYLIDVFNGVWIAWSSPEFAWLRWVLVGFIVGAVLSWFAAREWYELLEAEQDQTAKNESSTPD